jgi:signal transduction histidine kinase
MKHVSGVVTELKKLNVMLNSLLELAQINRDNTIQLACVRIDEIIYNSILQIKNRYPGRKIVLKITHPENGNDLLINGNTGLLTIAFNNLIENACKFSEEDVTIEFLIMDKFIKITIADSGIGIPSEEFANIYKPFKRASNVRFKGGFGIGLSLVARIINLHNASIDVFSEQNKGTKFELTFNRGA